MMFLSFLLRWDRHGALVKQSYIIYQSIVATILLSGGTCDNSFRQFFRRSHCDANPYDSRVLGFHTRCMFHPSCHIGSSNFFLCSSRQECLSGRTCDAFRQFFRHSHCDANANPHDSRVLGFRTRCRFHPSCHICSSNFFLRSSRRLKCQKISPNLLHRLISGSV